MLKVKTWPRMLCCIMYTAHSVPAVYQESAIYLRVLHSQSKYNDLTEKQTHIIADSLVCVYVCVQVCVSSID